MALFYKKEGDILEVREEIYGWTDTKISWWYYDTENWLCSSHGRKDDPLDRKMSKISISFVKTHYLPKVST